MAISWRLALAAIFGATLTLAFPPFDQWVAIPVAVLAAWWLTHDLAPRRALGVGWVFGFAHFLTGVYWVYVSTHVYGGAPAWLSVILALVLAAYLALYPALALAASAVVGGASSVIMLPMLWGIAEVARGWMFTGFSWLSLGVVAADLPRVHDWLPVVGAHGVSVLLVAAAMVPAALLIRRWAVALVLATVLVAATVVLPRAGDWTHPSGEGLSVALVQGNIPQDQKWRPENRDATLEQYRELTQRILGVDLAVWPEVALPVAHHQIAGYLRDIDAMSAASQTMILAGMIRRENGGPFNTVYALGAGNGRYTKRHLVPFGEYFPVPEFLMPVFRMLDLPYTDVQSSRGGEPPLEVDGQRLAMSICFEDVFGDEFRRPAAGSGLLVNVTNDAWFAGTPAPMQHAQIARARMWENARPLIRVANTGVSQAVEVDGVEVAHIPWGQTGTAIARVQPRSGLTPYQRYGDLLILMIAGTVGLITGLIRFARPQAAANS